MGVVVVFGGCQRGQPTETVLPDVGAPLGASPASPGGQAARSATAERLFALYHAQWVSGDLARARGGLSKLVEGTDAPASLRASAALRLAEIADLGGNRREALGFLGRVAALVGPDHPLSRKARDRRERIRIAVPLAEVRGPAPDTVTLPGASASTAAAFRRAEKRLVAFHRIVVAPRLENVDAVVRTKRRALGAALKAYRKVAEGGGVARGAAHFRMGAMFHHFAEALAFDLPAGLLPAVAQKLTRKLRGESVGYLRKALSHYERASDRSLTGTGVERWRDLARRESKTLRRVLGKQARQR